MKKKYLYIGSILLIGLCSYLLYDYYVFLQNRNILLLEKGDKTLASIRDQIDEILIRIVDQGEHLSEVLGGNDYSEKEIEQLAKQSALEIKEIQGVTIGYEPYAFSPDISLYCPYYDKGTQSFIDVADSYDYTDANLASTTWYTGVRDTGAKWVEPYYGVAAKDWYVDYGIPFYYKGGVHDGKVRGTITLSFVCSSFKELVHSMSIGKTGYGIMTSNEGKFLVHPVNDYIGTTNLEDISREEKSGVLSEAYNKLLKGEKGNISFYDENIKDETLFFYDKIVTSGWGFGLTFYKNDILQNSRIKNRKFIHILLAFSLLVLCLISVFYSRDYLDKKEITILSVLCSFLLVLNICLIGYLKHTATRDIGANNNPPITDMAALGSFVNQQNLRSEKLKTPTLRQVPTGIYIHRLQFEDSYNLSVGGTVWQKYPLDIIDDVTIGFTLPQMSPFAEASHIEESYRKVIEGNEDDDGYLLVGWDIRVTLRLNLEYSDYPLDKRHVNIEIQPQNNNDHLIFTPDLSSYTYTNVSQKSGLNPNIKVSGSEVLESYFNLSTESYDTDFGYSQKGLFEEVPVLHFNILVRRLLLNAFVTYLIPIFVALAIVFLLLLSCSKTAERQGIVESMAAILFVLIFSHVDLRKEVLTADLIYMEFFYFISYIILVITNINLLIYTKDKSDIFDFNENQVFKALYFPFFFLAILVVTLIKFY